MCEVSQQLLVREHETNVDYMELAEITPWLAPDILSTTHVRQERRYIYIGHRIRHRQARTGRVPRCICNGPQHQSTRKPERAREREPQLEAFISNRRSPNIAA